MYYSLGQDAQEVRLLLLLPGNSQDCIRCRLVVKSLRDSPDFEALSYVWGSSKDLVRIEIDGQEFQVTSNLECGLRHLRDEQAVRTLWVDALCINQKDNDERVHQVTMMGSIYREAKHVIVWLGPIEEDEEDLRMFQQLARDQSLHWDSLQNNSKGRFLFLELAKFMDNPWYERIWTLQEAVLARDLSYVRGNIKFTRCEMDRLCGSYARHIRRDKCCSGYEPFGPAFASTIAILMNRQRTITSMRSEVKPIAFLDIASKIRYRRATDPRDKIYGVLGLVKDLPKDLVDYNVTKEDVYCRTVVELIKSSGKLDILSHTIPKLEPATYIMELPSWAPDWSSDYSGTPYTEGLAFRWEITKRFNACGNTVCQPDRPTQTCLGLKGILYDKLLEFGPVADTDYLLFAKYHPEWRKIVNVDKDPERFYLSGCVMLDAFWRTLCSDMRPSMGKRNDERTDIPNLTTRQWHDKWWWDKFLNSGHPVLQDTDGLRRPGESESLLMEIFFSHVHLLAVGRKFFISEKGYIGLAPESAKKGDEIWILAGGRVPYIVRPLGKGLNNISAPCHNFLGDAYVHGIMYGEFMTEALARKVELEDIYLL